MRISDWSSDVCSSDLVLRSREIGAEEVRGARLERLAVLHHRFDRPGFDRAGETFMLGLLARDHGHREAILREIAIEIENLERFGARFVGAGVRGMEIGRASGRGRVCQYV